MSFLVDILTSIFNGLKRVGTFLTSLPSLIVSSAAGVLASLVQLISSFTGNSFTSSFYGTMNQYVEQFSSATLLGQDSSGAETFLVWVLGVDVAVSWMIALFSLVFEVIFALFTFFLVAVPSVVVPIFIVKFGIWVVSALLPSGWRPSGAGGTGNI